MKKRMPGALALAALALMLAACGGGGGGGGDGGNPPPPPPPSAGVTYSLELTGLSLSDRQAAGAVSPTGLPVSGAVATRNP